MKLFDLLGGLSGALDLICPEVVGHHRRVAWMAGRIGEGMGMDEHQLARLVMAGLLHDVGAFSLQTRIDTLDFDTRHTSHAETGYELVRRAPAMSQAARIIRWHHTHWDQFETILRQMDESEDVLLCANIIFAADRVDVLLNKNAPIPPQLHCVQERIRSCSGNLFDPKVVGIVDELCGDLTVWLDMAAASREAATLRKIPFRDVRLSSEQTMDFSAAFSHVIDFRSRFTATHSRGVAETAVALAHLAGMDHSDLRHMRLAGNLHDVGKLAVPSEILEKPAPLTDEEFEIMKRHPMHTDRVLKPIPELSRAAEWATQHHERLHGGGYPLGLSGDRLHLGSRILSVADVFTAITEDRPYRAGMTRSQALDVLDRETKNGGLDGEVVALLRSNFTEVDDVRLTAQREALEEFRDVFPQLEAFAN